MAFKGLGRGLDALLADNAVTENSGSGITVLHIADIEPNKNQVRKKFDPESIAELADSIKEHGLIQPIVVRRRQNGFYEIIAGERRWRACKSAGLNEVPVIIKDIDDKSASLVAMVENLQREDLNPVEEAKGYAELSEKFGLTQEETAKSVGKSRSAVANIMRLLVLPESILAYVKDKKITYGHARTLIPLVNNIPEAQIKETAELIFKNDISVRETEKLVKKILESPKEKPVSVVKSSYYKVIESKASSKLGRRLSIKEASNGSGKVTLAYSSAEDLEILLKNLCGNNFFENTGD